MDNKPFNPSEIYISTINNMISLYEYWNTNYFQNELKVPVITVRQDERRNSYGWFISREIWTTGETDESSSEINMSSQFMNRSLDKIAETMLHEMCHQYAYSKGIRDTSRYGYYHNKKFKKIAEEHGLRVGNSGSYHGWCITELTEEAQNKLKDFVFKGKILYDSSYAYDPNNFGSFVVENDEKSKKRVLKKSSTRKYCCPCCCQSIRATKEVYLICGNCKETLIAEKDFLQNI